jgi:glycosyltransferase involved in cell wall biosynthesis
MNSSPSSPRSLNVAISHANAAYMMGGSVVYVWQLAKFLIARKHSVVLVAGQTASPVHLVPEVPLEMAPFKSREKFLNIGSRYQRFMERCSFMWNARGLFYSRPVDILNIHKPYDLPVAAWIKRKTGCRIVWRCHGPDYYPGLQRLLRSVDATYCVSECCRANLLEHYDVAASVIYTGVDTKFFEPTLRSRPNSKPVILYFGRLEGWKGVAWLTRAIPLMKENCVLRIVGEGPEQPTLAQLIRDLNLSERIELLPPARGRVELRRVLSDADITVFPAIGLETMSNAMLEAMSMAKPIAASNIACFAEVLAHQSNALLVPPRDSAALAAALDRLLREPSLRSALGESARRDALAQFDSNASFEKVEALFHEVAGRNAPRQ